MPTLRSLRESAANFWWHVMTWMGNPADLARQGFASLHSYRLLREWIVTLETLVRRIVYLAALQIDAATLALSSTRNGGSRTAPVISARRPCLRIMRARYASSAPVFRFRRRRDDDDRDHLHPMRIGRLARRFEALRHAIWHTRPHAERLARLLKRREAKGKALPQLKAWQLDSKRPTVSDVEVGPHIQAVERPIADLLSARALTGKHEEPG